VKNSFAVEKLRCEEDVLLVATIEGVGILRIVGREECGTYRKLVWDT
jgi:hypothetical protein